MSNDTTAATLTPDKNAFVCIKQTATQVRPTQQRRPRQQNGIKQAPKVARSEDGRVVVQPCQFLIAPNRAILENSTTHVYLTKHTENLLTALAHDLNMSGAVIDTKNKLLSAICNTKEFAALAQKLANQMLLHRNTSQVATK